MDDTAFHYSQTLRIIMVLAILLPIIGIGAILWYFYADDTANNDTPPEEQAALEEELVIED